MDVRVRHLLQKLLELKQASMMPFNTSDWDTTAEVSCDNVVDHSAHSLFPNP